MIPRWTRSSPMRTPLAVKSGSGMASGAPRRPFCRRQQIQINQILRPSRGFLVADEIFPPDEPGPLPAIFASNTIFPDLRERAALNRRQEINTERLIPQLHDSTRLSDFRGTKI